MDEDSNATVLMEDDDTLITFSTSHESNDKKIVLVGGVGNGLQELSSSTPGHYLPPLYQFE
jgi:hypothetical protein